MKFSTCPHFYSIPHLFTPLSPYTALHYCSLSTYTSSIPLPRLSYSLNPKSLHLLLRISFHTPLTFHTSPPQPLPTYSSFALPSPTVLFILSYCTTISTLSLLTMPYFFTITFLPHLPSHNSL